MGEEVLGSKNRISAFVLLMSEMPLRLLYFKDITRNGTSLMSYLEQFAVCLLCFSFKETMISLKTGMIFYLPQCQVQF